jgi:hypothetical protein
MDRMLGKSYAVWARIKLPNGGAVYGLEIKPRRSRRIKRAREAAALRRSLGAAKDA